MLQVAWNICRTVGPKRCVNIAPALTTNERARFTMATYPRNSTYGFKSIDPDLARSVFIYDPETGNLIWKPREGMPQRNAAVAGKVAGHRHICTVGKAYIQVRVDRVLHYAHRIIWVMHHGPIPAGMQIDHIDGDGTNNMLNNLRMVSPSENKRNMRKMVTNKTGHTGVQLSKSGTYIAAGWSDGRPIHLGTAKTIEGAILLRKQWEAANGYHPNHGQDRPL